MPKVSELERGEKFDAFFRIREFERKQTRAGKTYLDLVLEDRTGTVPAKVWEVAEQVQGVVERGDFVKVRADVEDYKGALQLRVQRIRKINDADRDAGFDPGECVEQTPYDIEVMFEECRRISQGCHPLVAELLLSILDAYADRFRQWPAAQRIHHPYLGGLIEHTLSVTKTCVYLADKYGVSRDLLLAGALLHDIGKLEELSVEGGSRYTPEGRLIGHIVLGWGIVRDHARRLGKLPEGFLLQLEHLILSHQGQPEWGAVKSPMTPEALLLHYADDMDAKFNLVVRAIEQDRSEEEFTSWNSIMGRPLYKMRPLLPPAEDAAGEADGSVSPDPETEGEES